MRSLKDLAIKKKGWEKEERKLDDKTVFFAFEKIIGEWYGFKGRENIFPEEWVEGTLLIRVRSSLWLNELLLEKEKLQQTVNVFLGGEPVKRITFRRG
ncbi:MAG: hypothetical protein QG606_400 [Patescibacteria group bacterium]|jgi:predicted nucleic acid-binding Zn ribbon protein|nr:hypothetical protein [Patescibacteria group bacterium]